MSDSTNPPILTTKHVTASNICSSNDTDLTLLSNHSIHFDTDNLLIRYQHFDKYVKNLIFGSHEIYGAELNDGQRTYENEKIDTNSKFKMDHTMGTLELHGLDAIKVSSENSYVERTDGHKENYVHIFTSNNLHLLVPGTSNIKYGDELLSNYIYNLINNPDTPIVLDTFISVDGLTTIDNSMQENVENFGEYITGSVQTSYLSTQYTCSLVDGQLGESSLTLKSASAVNLNSSNIFLNDGVNLDDYIKQFLNEDGMFGLNVNIINAGTKVHVQYNSIDSLSSTEDVFGFSNNKYGDIFSYDITYTIHIYDITTNSYNDIPINIVTSSNIKQGQIAFNDKYTLDSLSPGNVYEIRSHITNTTTNTTIDYGRIVADLSTIPGINFEQVNVISDSQFNVVWTHHNFDVTSLDPGFQTIYFRLYVKVDDDPQDGTYEFGDGAYIFDNTGTYFNLGYPQSSLPSNPAHEYNSGNLSIANLNYYGNSGVFRFRNHKFIIVSTNNDFSMETEFIFDKSLFGFDSPGSILSISTSYDLVNNIIYYNIQGITNYGGTSEINYNYTLNGVSTIQTITKPFSLAGQSFTIQDTLDTSSSNKLDIVAENIYELRGVSVYKEWCFLHHTGELGGFTRRSEIDSNNRSFSIYLDENTLNNRASEAVTLTNTNHTNYGYDTTLDYLEITYSINGGGFTTFSNNTIAYNLNPFAFYQDPYINPNDEDTAEYIIKIRASYYGGYHEITTPGLIFKRPSPFTIKSVNDVNGVNGVNVLSDTQLEISWNLPSTQEGTGTISYKVTSSGFNSGNMSSTTSSYTYTTSYLASSYLASSYNDVKVTATGTGTREVSYGSIINVASYFNAPSNMSKPSFSYSGNQLYCSWTAPVKSSNGKPMSSPLTYTIQLYKDNQFIQQATITNSNSYNSFSTGGNPGNYYVKVNATNIYGYSNSANTSNSHSITYITVIQPTDVSGISFTNITQTTIDISWNPGTNGDDGYGNIPTSTFIISGESTNGGSTPEFSDKTDSSARAFNLTSGKTYRFTVNKSNSIASSSVISSNILTLSYTNTAPSPVTITSWSKTQNSITINWSPGSNGTLNGVNGEIIGYTINISPGETNDNVDPGSGSYTFTDLSTFTLYSIYIIKKTTIGDSSPTEDKSIETDDVQKYRLQRLSEDGVTYVDVYTNVVFNSPNYSEFIQKSLYSKTHLNLSINTNQKLYLSMDDSKYIFNSRNMDDGLFVDHSYVRNVWGNRFTESFYKYYSLTTSSLHTTIDSFEVFNYDQNDSSKFVILSKRELFGEKNIMIWDYQNEAESREIVSYFGRKDIFPSLPMFDFDNGTVSHTGHLISYLSSGGQFDHYYYKFRIVPM